MGRPIAGGRGASVAGEQTCRRLGECPNGAHDVVCVDEGREGGRDASIGHTHDMTSSEKHHDMNTTSRISHQHGRAQTKQARRNEGRKVSQLSVAGPSNLQPSLPDYLPTFAGCRLWCLVSPLHPLSLSLSLVWCSPSLRSLPAYINPSIRPGVAGLRHSSVNT